MKKYLFGLFAVALAIVSFAFTAPKSTRANVYVLFTGSTSSLTDVQDESKWEKVTVTPTCDGVNDKACRIQVDDSKLTAGSPQKLNPEYISVIAEESENESGSFFVLEIQDGTVGEAGATTIRNKD